MARRYTAKIPADLSDLCAEIEEEIATDIHLTLQLYRPLFGTHIKLSDTFGPDILEPLFSDWVKAIRDVPAAVQLDGSRTRTWRFIIDITRPVMPKPLGYDLVQHEARGFLRIAARLRSKYRDRGQLESTLIGAPCWRLLRESEKHVALPKGSSWPVQRASHVPSSDVRTKPGPREEICLTLAKKHWNDEHWGGD